MRGLFEEVNRDADPGGDLDDPNGFRTLVAPARGSENKRLQAKSAGQHRCANPCAPATKLDNSYLLR